MKDNTKATNANIEKAKNKIIGKRFGRLLVLNYIPGVRKPGHKMIHARVVCKCDCGNSKIVRISSIRNSNPSSLTFSCGCLSIEKTIERSTIHGMTHTSEYNTYHTMKRRCYKETCESYKYYGARGITICASWLDEEYGFLNFFRDMGKKPSKQHSIDRINNNGNYEPSNCRWATAKEQNSNKRPKNCLIF